MRTRPLAVLAALVLLLAACADDDDAGSATTAPADDPTTTAPPADDGDAADVEDGDPEDSGEGEVVVVNVTMAFEPSVVEVNAGDTVRWESAGGGVPHTVTSTSGSMDFDESLPDGGSVSITFDEPGTYEYECTIHPSMTGTIVVS